MKSKHSKKCNELRFRKSKWTELVNIPTTTTTICIQKREQLLHWSTRHSASKTESFTATSKAWQNTITNKRRSLPQSTITIKIKIHNQSNQSTQAKISTLLIPQKQSITESLQSRPQQDRNAKKQSTIKSTNHREEKHTPTNSSAEQENTRG